MKKQYTVPGYEVVILAPPTILAGSNKYNPTDESGLIDLDLTGEPIDAGGGE